MVESSSLLKQKVPILPETAAVIGDVQVRNRGTIGGSIAHADPAGDLPGAAVALDLQLKAVGPRGERSLSAREFFVDILTTALQPDEILTEIRVPAMAPRTGSAYEKFPNPASRYAIVGAAAVADAGRQWRVPEGQRRPERCDWDAGSGRGSRTGPDGQARQ